MKLFNPGVFEHKDKLVNFDTFRDKVENELRKLLTNTEGQGSLFDCACKIEGKRYKGSIF